MKNENSNEDLLTSLRALNKQSTAETTGKVILNLLSCTPYIGGGFSAIAGWIGEREQNRFNNEIIKALEENNNRIASIEHKDIDTPIVGFIKFKTKNLIDIVKSRNVSSIADHGGGKFSINFTTAINDYVFQFYGSSHVEMKACSETSSNLTFEVVEPLPEQMTLIFTRV